jgi:hypothetical protein
MLSDQACAARPEGRNAFVQAVLPAGGLFRPPTRYGPNFLGHHHFNTRGHETGVITACTSNIDSTVAPTGVSALQTQVSAPRPGRLLIGANGQSRLGGLRGRLLARLPYDSLFLPQRHHRIYRRGAKRGNQARLQRHDDDSGRCSDERRGIARLHAEEHRL